MLLKTYPREFRREYGSQMEQTFRDLCREQRRRGERIGLLHLWANSILDLISSVIVERSGVGRVGEKEMVLRDYKLAGLGIALLLAPLYFVSASLLKYGLGISLLFDPLEAFLSVSQRRDVFNLISPILFLGGLGLAVVLNVYPVLRLNVGREDGVILSTIRIEMKLVNVAVVVISLMLMSTLLGYAVLENFTIR
jgi:hypothetical protein